MRQPILYFSDVLKKVGLDPAKVKLLRHAMSDRGFRECYKANAVYRITDRKEGTQYVGSAYGKEGLWGRWAEYIAAGGHGGNKKMRQAIKENPQRCHDLQFSVLQILSKSLSEDEIIKAETLWKNELLTKIHGWNDN